MIRVMQFADILNRHDFIDVIVQRADRKRFQIFLALRTFESDIAQPVFPPDVPVHLLAGTERRWALWTAFRLANLLRRYKIDILHTHHYDEAFIGRVATMLHPKTKLIVGRHYADVGMYAKPGLKLSGLLAVERFAYRGAKRVIVPTNVIRENVLSRGLEESKVVVVPYGFFPEKYAPFENGDGGALRSELGWDGRVIFGAFSRLNPGKGVHVLLEALAEARKQTPQASVVVCGEGPERNRLEKMIMYLHLQDHVRLLGWRKDAMQIMSGVDVVVGPTFHEAFSQVMGEACFLGKPLIFTCVSGAADVIHDGKNGILIPIKESAPLAAAIVMLAKDENLRKSMGAAGREVARTQLHVDHVISQFESVYEEVVAQP